MQSFVTPQVFLYGVNGLPLSSFHYSTSHVRVEQDLAIAVSEDIYKYVYMDIVNIDFVRDRMISIAVAVWYHDISAAYTDV